MKMSIPRSLAAGILIGMGCIVNLKAGGGILGAVLFSSGLWFVVNFDAELFTGRVTQDQYPFLQRLLMLLVNVTGAALCGLLASVFLPEVMESAVRIVSGYADPLKLLWQSFMCGICMYLATAWPPKAPWTGCPLSSMAWYCSSSPATGTALPWRDMPVWPAASPGGRFPWRLSGTGWAAMP